MKPLPRPSITALVEEAGGQVMTSGGVRQKTKCPLHDDRTPSASVNEDEGRFTCFSCDITGDQIDFIMAWKGIEFKEAVEVARTFLTGTERATPQRAGSSLTPSRRKGRGFTPKWKRF